MKDVLAAKNAGAAHDWAALLPQLRMEYMQRRHSVTGSSPRELVHGHPLRLRMPPPVRPNHPPFSVAAVQLHVLPEEMLIQKRHKRSNIVASRVYDHVLIAQQRNAGKQTRLLASRKASAGGGEEIATWRP